MLKSALSNCLPFVRRQDSPLYLLIGQAIPFGVQFLLLIYFSRRYGSAEFGQYGVAIALSSVFGILDGLGVPSYFIFNRKLSAAERGEIRNGMIVVSLVSTLLVGSLVLLFDTGIWGWALFWGKVLGMLTVWSESFSSVLFVNGAFQKKAVVDALCYVGPYFGGAVILESAWSLGLASVIYAFVLCETVRMIVLYIACEDRLTGFLFWWRSIELRQYASGLILGRLVNQAMLVSDQLFFSLAFGLERAGDSNRALSLVRPFGVVFGDTLDRMLFIQISGGKGGGYSWYLKLLATGFVLFSLVALFISTFSELVVTSLYGEEWSYISAYVQIFMVGLPFRVMYKMGDGVVRALGFTGRRAKYQIALFFTLFGGLFVSYKFGFEACLWWVVVTYMINFVMVNYLVFRLRREL